MGLVCKISSVILELDEGGSWVPGWVFFTIFYTYDSVINWGDGINSGLDKSLKYDRQGAGGG